MTPPTAVTLGRELVASYGSFLFFARLAPNLLLVACTLLDPWAGLLGLAAGLVTLLTRRMLSLPSAGGMEGGNGMLAGLFLGTVFAPGWAPAVLALAAGPLTMMVALFAADLLARSRLPLLSGAFVPVAWLLTGVGHALALPLHVWVPEAPIDWLAPPAQDFLRAVGGIYLTPGCVGGALVLAAIAWSSRTMVLLTVLGFGVARLVTAGLLGLPAALPASNAAATAAILAAIMVGGIFARPGRRALAVAALGAACAALFSLAFTNILWFVALPPLSLPYLATTWLMMIALGAERGGPWARYWQPWPCLPEFALHRIRQAEARGLSARSLALRAPFAGRWTVYQAFEGPHTHRPPRQHALDLFRLVDGHAFRGEGHRLEDYHCFGVEVRSPAYGWVYDSRGDLPDNPPGEVDVVNCWGNHVLIVLATGDYVLLAHLRQGSVTAVPGMWLVPGQVVGSCGSSGRSPQPHLHLQVQTGPALGAPTRPFHLAGVCFGEGAEASFVLDGVPGAGTTVWLPAPDPALARGLHWPVGSFFSYADAGGAEVLEVDVTLDPAGGFRLESGHGARISMVETGELLALYDRAGSRDRHFDALVLAVGLTPFLADEAEWRDAPPPALLPRPGWLRLLQWLLPALLTTSSRYRRRWDATAREWVQSGRHAVMLGRHTLWSCHTAAHLPETGGIAAFTLEVGGTTVSSARLAHFGLRADAGVPGWTREAARAA